MDLLLSEFLEINKVYNNELKNWTVRLTNIISLIKKINDFKGPKFIRVITTLNDTLELNLDPFITRHELLEIRQDLELEISKVQYNIEVLNLQQKLLRIQYNNGLSIK